MARSYSPLPSDEIAAAVFAVLSKANDWEKLWWISIGLVNDALELDWKSFVNDESEHAKQYCGDADTPPKCKPKPGHAIPPCAPENISRQCSFRKALNKLEKATMHPKSHSQGRISIILWNEFKEAPYISIHKADYPWLIAKSGIKRNLQNRANPLLRRSDPSNYEKIAEPCMVSEAGKCSAALIPLLQHRAQGDNAYVGAIIVCASAECGVWSHLPHVRAVATSLLETRRHLRAVVSKKDKDLADLLLDELVDDLDVGQNLFAGKCEDSDCPKHKQLGKNDDKRKRHDYECRLLRKKNFFIGENRKPIFDSSDASLKLQKSLFSFGKIRPSGGRGAVCEKIKQLNLSDAEADSHATTLSSVAKLFTGAFGVRLSVPAKARNLQMVWPIKPGILILVGLYDVFRQLRGKKGNDGSVVKATITENPTKNCRTVKFAFALRGKVGATRLKKRLEAATPIGETTTVIRELCDARPTRPLIPMSQWEHDIIQTLNAPAPETIRWNVDLNLTPPRLFIEWDCPQFKKEDITSTLSS